MGKGPASGTTLQSPSLPTAHAPQVLRVVKTRLLAGCVVGACPSGWAITCGCNKKGAGGRMKRGNVCYRVGMMLGDPSLSQHPAQNCEKLENSEIKPGFLGHFIKVYLSKDEDRTYFI